MTTKSICMTFDAEFWILDWKKSSKEDYSDNLGNMNMDYDLNIILSMLNFYSVLTELLCRQTPLVLGNTQWKSI